MEQIILSWLQSHIAMVATWLVSLSAVSLAIKKYGPKVRRFVKIGREAMDLIDTLLDVLQDNTVTDEDIQKVIKEVNDFKEAIK